jgi:hypothetical protein
VEKKIDLIQIGGKIKSQKDIDHHGPKNIPIICHIRDPLCFSLVPPTFKQILNDICGLFAEKNECITALVDTLKHLSSPGFRYWTLGNSS